MIPDDALDAAKEAMREVTPPPGVTKAEWLAKHGGFALIAGAIAAAAPHLKHIRCEECGKCRVVDGEEWCGYCEYWSCERGEFCADAKQPAQRPAYE